ncbi:alpha/beta fold hydrolase [Pseudomonas sp. Irchel 3H3]|uniref:alpha/beta fold hydrolase n=1 Tax=Pseudomonas sp. Irchel 3H3 TaxID=2009038 RepID=UPI000BA313C5|nr:alpha/beta fold hydrolase [Pseudomonas sp. Irchel 3H3]
MDVDPRFTRHDKSRNRLLAHLLSLALALLPCLATARADGLPPPGTALQSRAIQVGDTTWAYYEGEKNGPSLLLVHGFASGKDVWARLAADLGTDFHLIIPDLPGWGQSTRLPGQNYDIEAQATRLDGFIQALDLQQLTLVGHSMGGAITGVHAVERPQRVARLALIGSLGLSFVENDFIRALNAGDNPFIYDDRAGVERTARLVYLDPLPMSDQQVADAISLNRAQRPFIESTLEQIRPPSQWQALDPRLGRLNIPVLGVGCREDRVIDISALQTLENRLPPHQARQLVTLDDCNHLPMLERPVETARLLRNFANG